MLTPRQDPGHKNYGGLDVSPATVERIHSLTCDTWMRFLPCLLEDQFLAVIREYVRLRVDVLGIATALSRPSRALKFKLPRVTSVDDPS